MLRPGFLTVEYLSGRRERYVQPLKAYVIATVLFFGLVALSGETVMTVYLDSENPATARAINTFVNAAITYVHFFLVPVLAAIIMLFQRGSVRYYVEHLVFAFHYGAFAVLFLIFFAFVARVLGGSSHGPQPPAVQVLAIAWGTLLFGYLVAALRRVYENSWIGAFLRAIGIAILYSIAFLVISAALVFVAFLLYQAGVNLVPGPRATG